MEILEVMGNIPFHGLGHELGKLVVLMSACL